LRCRLMSDAHLYCSAVLWRYGVPPTGLIRHGRDKSRFISAISAGLFRGNSMGKTALWIGSRPRAPPPLDGGFGLPFWSETVQATPYGLSFPQLEPIQSVIVCLLCQPCSITPFNARNLHPPRLRED
jgi:hypothetical protein